MPKPSRFKKGKKLSEQQYQYKLQKYYQGHIEKNYTKLGHKCIDKRLFAKIKQEAKKKFKVFPSSYATNWIKSEYKKRGGKYKSRAKIINDKERKGYEKGQTAGQLFFNTSDATFYFNEKHIKKDKPDERKIVERRGDAKEGDLWIHPNTGTLHMKIGDRWVTVNDPSKLPKLNDKQRRADISSAFAERRKKEQTEVKEVVIETKPKITR